MKPRTGGLGQIYISCNNFAQLWEGMPYEFAECFVRQPVPEPAKSSPISRKDRLPVCPQQPYYEASKPAPSRQKPFRIVYLSLARGNLAIRISL